MLKKHTWGISTILGWLILVFPAAGQQSPAPDFIPESIFQGSQLTGWQPHGQANWQANNGVITGSTQNGSSGWLELNEVHQNIAFFSRFRCTGTCDAGILLRVEESLAGSKGVLVAIEGKTLVPYRVTLDKHGKIVARKSIQGEARRPPVRAANTLTSAVLDAATAALHAPVEIKEGEWNSIEIFVDANEVFNHLNMVRNAIPGGKIEDLPPVPPATYGGSVVSPDISTFGYGTIGLYLGSGSIAFEDVSIKNLNMISIEPEHTSSQFQVQQVNKFFYAWGADAADMNNDGETDLIAGPFYYLGPDFLTRHEFYQARVFNPGLEYVNDMLTFANDWNGDGWTDALVTERRPLVLYVNPKGEKRYWDRIEVLPDVCTETAIRADIDGDGAPEIAYVSDDGRVAYGKPDPANLNGPWLTWKISEPIIDGCNSHGLGVGDVNGDGLADILQARGWWEQPTAGPTSGLWIYHGDEFGRYTRPSQHPGGAEIAVYDFNGDGLNDVVSSLSAHGWGLAWYEQVRDEAGHISFNEHMIMGDFSTSNVGDVTFSQVHSGATLGDIDRDGIVDFVTGKRHWSHLDYQTDPDHNGEAVIYWYRTVRNPDAPGGVAFEPHLIHNKSGVGSEVKVLDINEDGLLDIVTSGTHGTFVFWGASEGR